MIQLYFCSSYCTLNMQFYCIFKYTKIKLRGDMIVIFKNLKWYPKEGGPS